MGKIIQITKHKLSSKQEALLNALIFKALSEVAICWENVPDHPLGIFKDVEATAIGSKLVDDIKKLIEK